MSDPKSDALKIGQLMLRDNALEKRIGELRDVAHRRAFAFAAVARMLNADPERLCFDGEALARGFAGENPISRKDLDIDSLVALLAELRSNIMDKQELRGQLAKNGLDLERVEEQELQRKSRALRFPSVETGAPENHGRTIGFAAHEPQPSK